MTRTQETMTLPLTQRKPRARCVCGCGQVGPIVGRGLRGVCYHREKAAGSLTRWPKQPRQAARLSTDPPRTAPAPEPPPAQRLPETLTLTFDGADLRLFGRLEEEARHARRTPEQQALHYLETYLNEG